MGGYNVDSLPKSSARRCENCIHKDVCRILESMGEIEALIRESNIVFSEEFEVSCKKFSQPVSYPIFKEFDDRDRGRAPYGNEPFRYGEVMCDASESRPYDNNQN